jgi:predicted nucleic acid-binding protein
VTGWLLDTNVVSELRKSRPEPKVARFVAAHPLENLFISEVTFAEIRFGVERLSNAARRADIRDWLTHKLRPMFEQRVLAITEDVILKWRLILEEGRKAGHAFPQPDLFIAATALHHGLTLVTRDTAHHSMAGAPVYNPWARPARSE